MRAAILIPTLGDDLDQSPLLISISAGLASVTFNSITEREVNLVAWPTLKRSEDTINYAGSGYSFGKKGRLGTGRYGKSSLSTTSGKRAVSEASDRRGYDKEDS